MTPEEILFNVLQELHPEDLKEKRPIDFIKIKRREAKAGKGEDGGYIHYIQLAKIVDVMIDKTFENNVDEKAMSHFIKHNFGTGNTVRSVFAYRYAPRYLKKEVENEKMSFSTVALMVANVCYKPKNQVQLKLFDGISLREASAIIKYVATSKEIMESKKTNETICIRNKIRWGFWCLNSTGELIPTAEDWDCFEIHYNKLEGKITFTKEIDKVITSLKTEDHQIDVLWAYREALEEIKRRYNVKDFALNHINPTPQEGVQIQNKLVESQVPLNVAKQVRLLAFKEYGKTKNSKKSSNADGLLNESSFNLNSEFDIALNEAIEIEEAIEKYIAETDTRGECNVRIEQPRIRKKLLEGKDSGNCALCGQTYQAKSLVAAHKKLRAKCIPEEKRDIENIAMLLCRFGCDHLYEVGFVLIDLIDKDYKVITNLAKATNGDESVFIERLNGRSLDSRWTNGNSKDYFCWHREHHS